MKRIPISVLALVASLAAQAPAQAQSVEPIGEIRMTFQGEEILFHTLRVTRARGDVDTTATVDLNRQGIFGEVNALAMTGTIGEDSRGGTLNMIP